MVESFNLQDQSEGERANQRAPSPSPTDTHIDIQTWKLSVCLSHLSVYLSACLPHLSVSLLLFPRGSSRVSFLDSVLT